MRTILPKGSRVLPKNAKLVFKGVLYDVYHWPQRMFDGSTATFEMLKRKDTVKVMAVKDGKLILIEERQPGHTRGIVLPGGRHDVASETELQCAQRELQEETGMHFKTWRLLHVQQPHDEIDWFVYIFLATDFERQQAMRLDSGEDIRLRAMDYDEACEAMRHHERWSITTAAELLRQAGSIDGLPRLPEPSVDFL